MLKLTSTLSALTVLGFLTGCATTPPKTELDRLYETNFEGLDVPSPATIKAAGEFRAYPLASYDEVWEACVFVLMQEGILARADKQSGVIVVIAKTPFGSYVAPSAIYVEKAEPISVYVKSMDDLGRLNNTERLAYIPFYEHPDGKKQRFEHMFDKLATQMYAPTRWKYLHNTKTLP